MTVYANGMNSILCSSTKAQFQYSIHKWAASDHQMKRYMGTGTNGLYGQVLQTIAPLNLVDEYDKGLATIQQWGVHG